MNQTRTLMDKCLAAGSLAALAALQPSQGWAAAPGALPWDYTLNVVQDFVTGTAADLLIVASLSSAGILAGIRIPRALECQHFLVAGSTGSGKSVAIRSLLRQIGNAAKPL